MATKRKCTSVTLSKVRHWHSDSKVGHWHSDSGIVQSGLLDVWDGIPSQLSQPVRHSLAPELFSPVPPDKFPIVTGPEVYDEACIRWIHIPP